MSGKERIIQTLDEQRRLVESNDPILAAKLAMTIIQIKADLINMSWRECQRILKRIRETGHF